MIPKEPKEAELRTGAPGARGDVTRRTALKILSASTLVALGGGVACTRKPARRIVSVSDRPEYRHPGRALYYASTWTEGTWPYGIMIKTLDGRPVKIEGLPEHPLSRGASTAAMQASILSLYDPERLRSPMRGAEPLSFQDADRRIVEALRGSRRSVLVTRSLLGPSERDLVGRFVAAVPGARHLVYEPLNDTPRRRVWRTVYGAEGAPRPVLSRARVILSIGEDFLGTDGDTLTAIRDFAATRIPHRGGEAGTGMSRLYVVEPAMTVTGSNADHRIPIRPGAALDLVQALRAGVRGDDRPLEGFARAQRLDPRVLRGLAEDLRSHKGASVVLGGPYLPGALHAAVALLNDDLRAPGKTLEWDPDPPALPCDDPAALAQALGEGAEVAILLGVNPVYDWPGGEAGGEGFGSLLSRSRLSVGHGLTRNETLAACTIALPSAHNLESWNDASPRPGMASLCQPVIAPLFGGRQEAESLLVWLRALLPEDPELSACRDWHDFVRRRWEDTILAGAEDKQAAWEEALRRGLGGTGRSSPFPRLQAEAAALEVSRGRPAPPGERGGGAGGLELVILPHPALGDGRFAGNPWLQELPDPVTRLVWDNAAMVGPATAARHALREGQWVSVRAGERRLDLPVLVQPGVADGVVATTLGHGRRRGAGVGEGHGVCAAPLVGAAADDPGLAPLLAAGVRLEPPSRPRRRHRLVRTQKTFSQEGRPIVREGTLAEFRRNPSFARERVHVPPLEQLHAEWDYSKGHKWAMAIDLAACVGCAVCSVACQAENNIPSVGKEECAMGREMSWIRIDRYHEGDLANPLVRQQPMLCQQCDNAPCENVCPVNATSHSPEGLNEQVYNRCVGTRYCANNCPYKVRRFNFFDYNKRNLEDPVQELLFNPQVTVRSRGVMEKCTFCIQRINEEKFRASNEGRDLRDGAIRPACEQACPAQAIVFGDRNDPASEVARRLASERGYRVLEELNVRPNVTYLARIRNPHPDLERAPRAGEGSPRGHG